MKRIVKFIGFFIVCQLVAVKLMAQLYPVQTTPQLLAPNTLNINEYYSNDTSKPKLNLLLLLRDVTRPNINVRLRMVIESQSVRIKTREDVDFTNMQFDLQTGIPRYVLSTELAPYFNVNNVEISGMSPQDYATTGRLPEGLYTFCFEAVDMVSGQTVSNKGCAMAWIAMSEPPFLTLPYKASALTPQTSQNVLFQWTPRHAANPNAYQNVEYRIHIVELLDEDASPEAGFLSRGTFFRDSGFTTTSYVYGPTKPQLIPGKRYAWRVQVKTRDGFDPVQFRNDGWSEIWWFTYQNDCPLPTGVNDSVRGTRATINWLPNPRHLEYRLDYREKNNANAEWFTLNNTQPHFVLTGLRPSTMYEYRPSASCESGIVADNGDTTLYHFTTSADSLLSTVPDCDTHPVVPDSSGNYMSLPDTIYAADFKVIVQTVSGGNGIFTGTGYVEVPWVGGLTLAVHFDKVGVDASKRLKSGAIKSTYDPTEGGIGDIDEFIDFFVSGYNVGNVISGLPETDTSFSFVIQWPGGINVSPTPPAPGPYTISMTPDGNGTPIPYVVQELPTSLMDGAGNIYQVNADGTVTQVGSGGGKNLLEKANKRLIDADKALVKFVDYPATKVKYAFDEWRLSYKGSNSINKEYERIPLAPGYTGSENCIDNNTYYVSAKAIAPSETDYLKAEIVVFDPAIKPDSVQFVSGKGTAYNKVFLDSTAGRYRYEISVIGGPAKDAQDIYALYRMTGSKTLNLGKVLVASYPRTNKKLVIVPVNGEDVNVDSIDVEVNRIYNKINVFYDVQEAPKFLNNEWDIDGNGKLEISDDRSLRILTDEMKSLNKMYKRDVITDGNTQYLFTIQYDETTAFAENLLGDMPRGKQFGYIFTNNVNLPNRNSKLARVAAHEVGHGAFALEHVTEYGDIMEGDEEMNNLIDYPAGNTLCKFQWDNIHDPAITFGFLQDENEGAYVEKVGSGNDVKWVTVGPTNFLTPSGHLITLPDKFTVLTYCLAYNVENNPNNTALVPNGSLYGFKDASGREYVADIDYTNMSFRGYFRIADKGIGRMWEKDKNKNRIKYEFETPVNNNPQTPVTQTKNIEFLHTTLDVCSEHETWLIVVPDYQFVVPPATMPARFNLYYPQYPTSTTPPVTHRTTTFACSTCNETEDKVKKRQKGAPSSIDGQFLKYTEFVGNGENLNITSEEKKTIQDFMEGLGQEFGTKVDVFIYPQGGSREGEANAAYIQSKANGNKAVKIEVGSDGSVNVGKGENGEAERGIFNWDFFGWGLGNECAAKYVDTALARHGSSNRAWRFCQRVYYGIKGTILCKIGEQATMGYGPKTRFLCGFVFEFFETLDVVQLASGLKDLGLAVGKAIWEMPRAALRFIRKVGRLVSDLVMNNPITTKQVLSIFVPDGMIEGFNAAKDFAKNIYNYYITNGNPWRYGQLTMMMIPIVLTLGEYAPVVFAKLGVTGVTVQKFAQLCNKVNQLTSLGFIVMLNGGKKCIAPFRRPPGAGAAINNIDEAIETIDPLPAGVESVVDDVENMQDVERFVDDLADMDQRAVLLADGERAIVTTGLNNIPGSNRLYLAIHGSGDVFEVMINGTTHTMNHRSLAAYLKKNFPDANDIVLLSCSDARSAQNLVNKLGDGKSVTAWDGPVTVYENGAIKGDGACKRYTKSADEGMNAVEHPNPPRGKADAPASGNSVTLGRRKRPTTQPFDGNGNLMADVTYTSGEFGYSYRTDALGRLEGAETTNLRRTGRSKRDPHDSETPGKRPGDHAGHIFADIFGGSGHIDNLVSMSGRSVNQGQWRNLERIWEANLNRGVSVQIKIIYEGNDLRPKRFEVFYQMGDDAPVFVPIDNL